MTGTVRVRIFGDRPGWPDLERQGAITNGQGFPFLVPARNPLVGERNLYSQEEGWQAADLLAEAPQAKMQLTRLDR